MGVGTHVRYFPDDDVLLVLFTRTPSFREPLVAALGSLAFGEEPQGAMPPEVTALKPKQSAAFEGRWEGDAGALTVEARGLGFVVAPAGPSLSADFPRPPLERGAKPAWDPSRSELVGAAERALAILEDVSRGSSKLFAEALRPGLPATWPEDVAGRQWPEHVDAHGPVERLELVGAAPGAADRVSLVWIRLHHAEEVTAVRLVLTGTQVSGITFDAAVDPFLARAAPTSRTRLSTFRFDSEDSLVLELKRKSTELHLTTPTGTNHVLRRPAD